jgi:hypothetical protein
MRHDIVVIVAASPYTASTASTSVGVTSRSRSRAVRSIFPTTVVPAEAPVRDG